MALATRSVFTALALWLGASQALAAGFTVDVAGSRSVPLAMPKPSGGELADTVWSTAWHDLEMSGYFKLISPDAYLDQSAGIKPGSFNFDDWTLLKTAVLVKTQVLPAGDPACGGGADKFCADTYVYYVVNGETLAGKRLRAPPGDARAVGHTLADTVLELVTGVPGIFGSRLSAVQNRGGNKEIVLLDLDGQGISSVTRNGSINLSPTFSPDGRQIAWTSYKRGNPDLYVKDLASGRVRTLSRARGINASPTFSPDGRSVAFARSNDGDSDIYIVDARSGAEQLRLTRGGGIDVSPTYAPDGSRIAFASERGGGSQIYIAPAKGGEATRASFVGDFNSDPAFSPDGQKIAFVSRQGGRFDIFVVGLDGRNAVRITQGMGDNEDPSWSPDGRYLIFSSTRGGRTDLWLSTADGRVQTQITKGGGFTQPSFVPR